MPSAERYARERAKAAAAGTTPYKQRIKAHPGVPRSVAEGHAKKGQTTLRQRQRRREVREALGAGPSGWCLVCGSKVETSRPNSFTDRECNNEVVRRWRADGEPKNLTGGSFAYVAALARDHVWVARRRAESAQRGVPLRRPKGVRVA